jgi:hypothetical protein
MWRHPVRRDGEEVIRCTPHQEDTMYRTTTRGSAALAGLLLSVLAVAAPASASDDPGPAVPPASTTTDGGGCWLERVGTQLVRCDDLTGAGATAPTFIPERR